MSVLSESSDLLDQLRSTLLFLDLTKLFEQLVLVLRLLWSNLMYRENEAGS